VSERGPSKIQTVVVGKESLCRDWELRAVKVVAIGDAMTTFDHGGPFLGRKPP
jgi:hypothetical protein